MNPMISCVMSNYNTNADMLREALDSILEQTFRDFEVILIDDCSSDEQSKAVLEEYARKDSRVRTFYNEKNMGLAASLNRGFAHAKGKYIARFDTDDLCSLDRFQIQYDFMERHPEIDLSSTFMELFGAATGYVVSAFQDAEAVRAQMLFACYIPHNTIMLRKSFWDANALQYDPAFDKAEDYDLWTRCLEKGGRIATIPKALVKYRIHSASVTQSQKPVQLKLANAIRMRQLVHLGLKPTEEEWRCHSIMCGSDRLFMNTFEQLLMWRQKLISANEQRHYYDSGTFRTVVNDRVLSAISRGEISKRGIITCMARCPEIFSPRNIYAACYKKTYGMFGRR